MKPVPSKWTFCEKQLCLDGISFLYKDRCVLRSDKQQEYINYASDHIYEPVATHEVITMMLCLTAAEDLDMEGPYVDNTYLYVKFDIQIIMENQRKSIHIFKRPCMVFLLLMSLYGTRQEGRIWGCVIHSDLLKLGFKVSRFDSILYFFRRGDSFFILFIVVADISFLNQRKSLLNQIM